MREVIFITGAGISVESGIPAFRYGVDALWDGHDPDKVCNIAEFHNNFDETHQFYNSRRVKLKDIEPNSAHLAIADLQRWNPDEIKLLTTNVDTLHEKAGSLVHSHIHGRIDRMVDTFTGEKIDIGLTEFDYKGDTDKRYKPDVIFFGEVAPEYDNLQQIVHDSTSDTMVVIIGSSETVVNFAGLFKGFSDARVVVINPDESMFDGYEESPPYDLFLPITATEAFSDKHQFDADVNEWLAGV